MSQEEKKKSSKTLLYILLGCGVLSFLVVLAIVVFVFVIGKKVQSFGSSPEEVIVKMLTASNPEIEVVEVDKENQKITIKNKKTGEIMVIDFSDVKKGKIQWEGKGGKGKVEIIGKEGEGEGKVEIQSEGEKTTLTYGKDTELPKWLPDFKDFEIANKVTSKTEEQISGNIELFTDKSIEDSAKILESRFKEKGFKINRTFTQTEGESKSIMLQGGTEDGNKSFFIIITEEGSRTKSLVNYTEKLN